MGASHLLSSWLAALLTSSVAAAVALTSGVVDLDLVFPLNDTYAPLDGKLPIVFALSSQPFQPALASTLQLHLSYVLLDLNNQSQSLASGDLALGTLSSTSVDNPYFFYSYSDKLAGRTTQFALQCTVSLVASLTSADNCSRDCNNQSTIITNPNLIYNAYFTTQAGAQVAAVSSSASNKTTCLPHASWSFGFNIDDYIQDKTDTYAVLAPNSPSFGPRPCAIQVDAATAASISDGIDTTTTSTSSPSGTVKSSAKILSPFSIIPACWSLLVLGLSAA